MNSIANALKEAGVTVPPLSQRLWLWIKDHPKATAREIEAQFKESVSPRLADMESRQMLTSVEVPNPARKGKRTLKGYSVTQMEYDLLPKPKKVTMPVKVSPPKPTAAPKPTIFEQNKINVESLTIAEARSLYLQLQMLFK